MNRLPIFASQIFADIKTDTIDIHSLNSMNGANFFSASSNLRGWNSIAIGWFLLSGHKNSYQFL
ncbi:hypothetical protein [Bacillus weihaiensis]|uniref:hypothetical protein n=1 Tax=Bacillus weihaiensis TaxID=1547283 RepID=UPI0023565B56|nr:hypothetical protein [Bacillus weihaiensis]